VGLPEDLTEGPGVAAELRISLVITTYNWPAALDLTLRSVARQSVMRSA
jgi:hypothetical protein